MSELGNSRFSDANALPWVESTGNEEQLKALESTALLPEPNQNDPPARWHKKKNSRKKNSRQTQSSSFETDERKVVKEKKREGKESVV